MSDESAENRTSQPGADRRPVGTHAAPAQDEQPEATERTGLPPWRRALAIVAITVSMSGLFAISYSLALGRPTPKHIATAIVAAPGQPSPALRQLQAATGNALELRSYPSEAAARRAINRQRVYAAVIESEQGTELLTSSASGASLARVLQQSAQPLVAQAPLRLRIADPSVAEE